MRQIWILRGLTAGVALVVLAGGLWAQAPVAPSKPAATVNGEPISMADVDRIADKIVAEKFKVHLPTDLQKRQVRQEVLNMSIDDVLMHQLQKKTGIQVDGKEVDGKLAELAESLKKQNPPQTLADFYRESGQSEAEVRANIVSMLQWAGYVKAHVAEANIKHYYDENKDFFDQVMVQACHIVLRVPPTASEGERLVARKQLEQLRAEIVGGKIDFAEAAKKHSQCPSAPNGGDIGYFSRKWMLDENFARAAFALKVGEVSDVVQSEYGLHIIKVTDRKPGTPSDYEKMKDEVRDFCVEEMRQSLVAQERKTAKIEVNLP